MTDMTAVITPKSDQLSADDFIGGPRTFRIERVDISPGAEQPVSIYLAGEDRAWKPCKSMSRVLVSCWGPDAKLYRGRSVTLYRDPKVKWGGLEVGGIRVSHLSDIEREQMMALTATKGKRAPFVVKPLRSPAPTPTTIPAAVEEAAGAVPQDDAVEAAATASGGLNLGEPSIATEAAEIEAKFKACHTLDALAKCKELTLADRKRIVAADGAYRAVFLGIIQREHDRILEGADA